MQRRRKGIPKSTGRYWKSVQMLYIDHEDEMRENKSQIVFKCPVATLIWLRKLPELDLFLELVTHKIIKTRQDLDLILSWSWKIKTRRRKYWSRLDFPRPWPLFSKCLRVFWVFCATFYPDQDQDKTTLILVLVLGHHLWLYQRT